MAQRLYALVSRALLLVQHHIHESSTSAEEVVCRFLDGYPTGAGVPGSGTG